MKILDHTSKQKKLTKEPVNIAFEKRKKKWPWLFTEVRGIRPFLKTSNWLSGTSRAAGGASYVTVAFNYCVVRNKQAPFIIVSTELNKWRLAMPLYMGHRSGEALWIHAQEKSGRERGKRRYFSAEFHRFKTPGFQTQEVQTTGFQLPGLQLPDFQPQGLGDLAISPANNRNLE